MGARRFVLLGLIACLFGACNRRDGPIWFVPPAASEVSQLAPPTLIADPSGGPATGGTLITIRSDQPVFALGATVTIGGVAATGIFVLSATEIRCTTGAAAPGAAEIRVTLPSTGAVVATPGRFYFLPDPVVVEDPAPSPGFGGHFASADIDRDGLLDLLVRARSGISAGILVLRADGLGGFTEVGVLADPVPESGSAFPASIATGDVTGDGLADVVGGAPISTVSGLVGAGEVFIFPGDGAGGFGAAITLTEPVPQADSQFGNVVAVADLTQDGQPDLIVGAWQADFPGSPGAGRVYVFPAPVGSASPLELTRFPASSPFTQFGISLATGDFNGDGRLDLVVGANIDRAAYTFLGTAAGDLERDATLYEEPPASGTGFGISVAAADLTGDGLADVLVGADMREIGGLSLAGAAYVLRSEDRSVNRGLWPNAVPLLPPIPEAQARFGSKVAVGDVTGDGLADAIVAAPNADPGGNADSGEVWVFPADGKGGFLPPWAPIRHPTLDPGAQMGTDILVADVTGDGKPDLVIGAPGGGGTGQVLIYPAP